MALALSDVLQEPDGAAAVLEASTFGCTVLRSRRVQGGVVIDLEFLPLPDLRDYPVERVRVSVHESGDVRAVPLGPARAWKHRNPSPLGLAFGYTGGELCLYYTSDPRELVWAWEDGLEAFVARVQRHLIFEEAWRRSGKWPVEDAPHGHPTSGVHPVESTFVRKEVKRWSRSRR